MVDKLIKELEVAQNALLEKDFEIIQLRAELEKYRRLLFGQKSEKSTLPAEPPPGPQLDIFGTEPATEAEVVEEVSEPKRERRSAPRRALPKDLIRQIIIVDVPEEEKLCPCCGKLRACIGEEVTEKLEIVPARLYVKQYKRPRYSCGSCKQAPVQLPLPQIILPKAMAGASLLAYLIVGKYADHLPLCRQERIFARHGIDLDRARTSYWLMEAADVLQPLIGRMKHHLISNSHVIGADETPLAILQPGGKKTKAGWLWVYRGDDHAPYTLFDYHESRGREGPLSILGPYAGWVVSDGYTVYQSIKSEGATKWSHAACWVHARRKFVEADQAGDSRAKVPIAIIGRLYGIESKAKEMSSEERQILRQKEALPVLTELRTWLDASLSIEPKSPLGKAIGYTLDLWNQLNVYTTDGRIPIDNNAVERAIRPAAIGRKNWLFAGSERGAAAAATFFTLLDSARRAGANPFDYLTDILNRLPGLAAEKLDELLPDAWQKANAASVAK